MRAVDKDQFPCVLSEFFDSSPLHRIEDDHLPRWRKGEYVSVCVCVCECVCVCVSVCMNCLCVFVTIVRERELVAAQMLQPSVVTS